MRAIGVRSLLTAPLIVAGRVTGVVEVGSIPPRRYSTDDARLLQLVADRMALAIDYHRLQAMTRMTDERADRVTCQLRFDS